MILIPRLFRLAPALIFSFLVIQETRANNITLSNLALVSQNTNAGINHPSNHIFIKFNVGWENSWRTSTAPFNHDAAWVFIKFRVPGGEWQHVNISQNGHQIGSDATIEAGLLDPSVPHHPISNPAVGAFIYRAADGTGNVNFQDIKIKWPYRLSGISDSAQVEIKVFGIEMVYNPEGSFSVGDGSATNVQGNFCDGNSVNPLLIGSENALTLGGTASGNLSNNDTAGMSDPDDFNNSITQLLPATFPKGFHAFYGMKHEISQQQYTDFLNTLNRTQQDTRTETSLAVGTTSVTNRYVMSNSITPLFRNGIRCDASIGASAPLVFYCDLNNNGIGGEMDDGQWIACNFLNWTDIAAYLDWACLRPMTELEFEKSCRGPQASVAEEYAWGDLNIIGSSNISNASFVNEITGTGGANAVYNDDPNVQGPMRVGVFARVFTNRSQSGSGYSGMLDLSGNVWERAISVGHPDGRAFNGSHGNGILSNSGEADCQSWPGASASGVGFRGGDWDNNSTGLRTSNRVSASLFFNSRGNGDGGRGVRSAP
jgi:formylglycine-generating enzyme required for sulfatase activity